MTDHVNRLQRLCRIDGQTIKQHSAPGSKYSASLFMYELKAIHGIDISTDVECVHPKYICNKHARDMYRFRDAFDNHDHDVAKPGYIHQFIPHSDECMICHVESRGRKKKRKISTSDAISMPTVNETGQESASQSNNYLPQPEQSTKHDHACLDAHDEVPGQSKVNQAHTISTVLIGKCIDHLRSISLSEKQDFFRSFVDRLDTDDRVALSHCIGLSERANVANDTRTNAYVYKDVNALSKLNLIDWVNQRNGVVVSFLTGIGGFDIGLLQDKHEYLLPIARALEQMYMIRDRSYISPLAFLLNMCIYTLTGSKLAVDLVGNSCPAGHYKTVTKWLRDQGTAEILCPDGDLVNVFDNEQVVGRKSGIKPGHKVSISIITNKGFVKMKSESLQTQEDLKPPFQVLAMKDTYLDGDGAPILHTHDKGNQLQHAANELINQSSQRFAKLETDHYTQLCIFIDSAIQNVKEELVHKGTSLNDKIDDMVEKERNDEIGVTCATCGTFNTKRKIVCEGCRERDGLKKAKQANKAQTHTASVKSHGATFIQLQIQTNGDNSSTVQLSENQSRYDHVASNHDGVHTLTLTDPVFCNPNSSETLARVLRKIGIENGIHRYGGTKRHWTFICCDGLPYLIVKKLKEEAVICTIEQCQQKLISKSQYFSHVKLAHKTCTEGTFEYEFDWFYIRIGYGHYEMNLIKSFFELNWTPFLETLCERMGFVTEAAKLYAKACKDLHKSWHLILIFHVATLRELVHPYVVYCMEHTENMSAKGFLKFGRSMYDSGERPNYSYIMDQVLRHSQGIINFRMAVRRNNSNLLKSAKFMTKELFHGRAHPRYQKIEIYDTLQDITMPSEVRDLNDRYVSITTSGHPSAGEDFDFILEEKNRQLKAWIPKGVPNDGIWQTVCRNNSVLEKVKHDTLSLFGLNSEKSALTWPDIEDSVSDFRCKLRKTKYLSIAGDHVSLSGMALDEQLVNFVDEAGRRRIHKIKTDVLQCNAEDMPAMRHPIPVTPSERQKLHGIDNMTIAQIDAEIKSTLDIIPDGVQLQYYLQLYKAETKKKEKRNFLSIS